ncbi:hypothetical protein [Lacticaseibacillus nasuensis]|uniref:hypothetical protein n=1 Tax=Lacticaseibacillus nasuensis TaxID=944671 RepID=UPI002247967F|nr:hypothetical protein [Lacticaseibacillus nasuensis]MCX2454916.1 hypothetical protein [Lacticaseibacillus nasuensis]
MDQFEISELADWLEANHDALLAKTTLLPEAKVAAAVDYLEVLAHPAADYLNMLQGNYFREESDHKLNLLDDKAPVAKLEDRIMVNHVDGSITEDKLNFTYNHEPVFDGEYAAAVDLNIVKYGLEVIGAVATTGHLQTVTAALSPDAVLTLLVAAHTFAQWQKA